MLSLSPRYDLFRFALPKDFLPTSIYDKYNKILNTTPGVIVDPINYLNESIKTINIPGISDILIRQVQHSSNDMRINSKKINTEPKTDITYSSSGNPLDHINKEFTVEFRLNQGLYNYFMLYETIFHRICEPLNQDQKDMKYCDPVFYIEILNEKGIVVSKILYYDVYIDGIEGINFDYSKVDRESDTFSVTFKFNNIDFDFIE